jgi:hypothetical protein
MSDLIAVRSQQEGDMRIKSIVPFPFDEQGMPTAPPTAGAHA